MLECGRVKTVDGDIATVIFSRHGECDRCHICRASNDGTNCELKVVNTLNACAGDCVKVEVYRRSTRVLSAALYLLPLALTAIGVAIGCFLSAAATAIIGAACFAAGIAIAIPIDVCVIRKKKGFAPEMTEIGSEAEFEANKRFAHACDSSAIKLK